MITAISIILYFVALMFEFAVGCQTMDPPGDKALGRIFLSATLFFFTLAACLQIFG
ncbi:hypothetical protein V6582_17800 [Agrobacterium vitis]|uniref:hypothetical protein n=1 Tax=Agrobacterium vitis TaxID=373 RepID=UPI0012E7F706|nr:hypothetical protein [Agrobacterium vitis]MVA23185.1 hypothetical protein [Agrobacterium vitis]